MSFDIVSRAPGTDRSLGRAIRALAEPWTGEAGADDSLMRLIGDARFVLLGEASHGTHDFYQVRAQITARLIADKGFTAVAVAADWPDAYRVNRYVRGQGNDAGSGQALGGFKRFPAWMWRNTEVVAFLDWLRAFNRALPAHASAVGFYGLDLYSLFTSIDEVLLYLERVDPHAAQAARRRYACFDRFGMDSERYAQAAGFGLSASCEQAVLAQLQELQAHAADYLHNDGPEAADALFHARQNARLVINAEHYCRTMFRGRISSWNLRDRHMTETLDALAPHLTQANGQPAKIVVWAHNSHVGDARATDAGAQGEWTLGQLVRQLYGDQARLIGMTTYQGSVTAASDWNSPAERKRVRPALAGSYEHAFHQSGLARFLLPLPAGHAATKTLTQPRLQRAIGVLYRPDTERESHYLFASLPRQFDAVLHLDDTQALQPLEWSSHWERGEAPETFPSGV